MTTLRAQFTELLEPILQQISNDEAYTRAEPIGMQLYGEVVTSQKAKETLFERAGLGDFQEKPEAMPIMFSDPIAGGQIVFTHIRRALAYNVSQEMFDHDQFAEIRKLETDLQVAAMDDKEVRAHLLLNNGFGTTDSGSFLAAGYDSLALFSTAHTRLDGGATQRNRPTTDANLTWTSLADGIQQFKLWRDHRGRRVMATPSTLWVSPQDELTAREILGSSQKPGTSNNDINAISGAVSVQVTQYVDDTNAWFLFAAPNQTNTIWFWDKQAGTSTETLDDDKIREITGRKARHGFSHGHGRWYGTYGTSGTT